VFQNEECEHLGVFSKILNENNISYQYIKLYEEEEIPNLNDYSAIIILGGPMNVYEERKYPFLKKENSSIKEALKINKPMLGICLGAQIIARAAGAKVYPAKRKEIGWFTLNLTTGGIENDVFRGLERQFTVFQWHGDTFDIPSGSIKLAKSNLFPNQAFSIGKTIYALQFHLEVTKKMILEWVNRYEDELVTLKEEVDPDEMLKSSEHHIQPLNNHAFLLFSNFLHLIR
jgi:GMP synthase-like glutamine amidotransferase|tara:strand:+ start:5347 stop:6036 length:690 start_codon:yes stop_codon:yes gene_type:complete